MKRKKLISKNIHSRTNNGVTVVWRTSAIFRGVVDSKWMEFFFYSPPITIHTILFCASFDTKRFVKKQRIVKQSILHVSLSFFSPIGSMVFCCWKVNCIRLIQLKHWNYNSPLTAYNIHVSLENFVIRYVKRIWIHLLCRKCKREQKKNFFFFERMLKNCKE